MIKLYCNGKEYKLKPGDIISIWPEENLLAFRATGNSGGNILDFSPSGGNKLLSKVCGTANPQDLANFISSLLGFKPWAKKVKLSGVDDGKRVNFQLPDKA